MLRRILRSLALLFASPVLVAAASIALGLNSIWLGVIAAFIASMPGAVLLYALGAKR